MPKTWPGGGPWVIAATSSAVRWETAAATIAAASAVRVALLLVGGAPRSPDGAGTPSGDGVGTRVEVRDSAEDPLSVDDVVGVVGALSRSHGLVLIVAGTGLLVPVGRAGWTLADLAWALTAPVVVVTGSGPDSANHTTLALNAVAGRDLAASVVVIGDDDDHCGLPVTPAGQIPADACGPPDKAWLNPILHATTGRPKPPAKPDPEAEPSEAEPAETEPAQAGRRTVSGTRVVLALMTIFVSLIVAVCGLALWGPGDTATPSESIVQVTLSAGPRLEARVAPAQPVPMPAPVRVPCPEYLGNVVATRPDAATTRRVDGAWKRIETWLAKHAPKSHASLRPPATAAEINALQARMSVAFPPDLVASLRRHNGVTGSGFVLPPFFQPIAVDRIAANWALTCRVMAGQAVADWWHRDLVPFATAGDGGCLIVDQRAGGHGRVGEFDPESGARFESWPASLADLLEGTARSLETGNPYDGRYRPIVVDRSLNWDIIVTR